MGWLVAWAGKLLLSHATTDFLKRIALTALGGDDNAAQVALKQIDAEIAARQDARMVRLASVSFWEMRLLTSIIAGCFTLHLVLVTLDTCFGFGWHVAKFPQPFDGWEGQILLSFFGLYGAMRGVSTVAAAIARR